MHSQEHACEIVYKATSMTRPQYVFVCKLQKDCSKSAATISKDCALPIYFFYNSKSNKVL